MEHEHKPMPPEGVAAFDHLMNALRFDESLVRPHPDQELRDRFAIAAMWHVSKPEWSWDLLDAQRCYRIADLMLQARAEEPRIGIPDAPREAE